MVKRILVINGPNLNMLGIREPEIYGRMTYAELERFIRAAAREANLEVELFQSNHEGALIDAIQGAHGRMDGIIINAGAYTHTSIALLDALQSVALPAAEVHLSNLEAREDFRRPSYVRAACGYSVMGRGAEGYRLALQWLKQQLINNEGKI
ncbi:MAG: type II 3-dehydroquinate dehydratase [Syntrophomonadaceae bacterium]|nr:type II 3-dehydroquinate dehydratase [Syntrophomonadaceae bacterium]